MADAKIEIKVGAVSFSGEGDGKWLSETLDKVLEKIPELAKINPDQKRAGDAGEDAGGGTSGGASGAGSPTKKLRGTLAGFLKDRKATTNQVRKFLATAVWLQEHDGKERLSTKDVSTALSDAKQNALTNPSQCLAHNVSQGFCQKDGKKQFYVTPDGIEETLGQQE